MYPFLRRHLGDSAVAYIWFAFTILSTTALGLPYAAAYLPGIAEHGIHAPRNAVADINAFYWLGAALSALSAAGWLAIAGFTIAGTPEAQNRGDLPGYLAVALFIIGSPAHIHPEGNYLAAACAFALVPLAAVVGYARNRDRRRKPRQRISYGVIAVAGPIMAASAGVAMAEIGPEWLRASAIMLIIVLLPVNFVAAILTDCGPPGPKNDQSEKPAAGHGSRPQPE